MSAKTSKRTTDKEKRGRSLLASLFNQGAMVAAAVLDIVRPHRADGDDEPDVLSTILGLARTVQYALGKVVAADERLFVANAAHAAAIKLRVMRSGLRNCVATSSKSRANRAGGPQGRGSNPTHTPGEDTWRGT